MPDGKFQPNRDQIIRKALDARHQASFVITRAKAVDPDDEASRTVEIICATDKPITHFLWSKWDYVDISIVMEKSAMRADRFENGAAFLMDHNTRDQRGVIESFSLKNGELRAVVRMSKSERGEELYQDILDGIRQQISLGFMIHKLTLVEERESEPDLYEARDWEPYEASSVAVAADLDAKVMRAIAARRDGLTTCPDCSETLRECICENSQILNATQTRAHSTNGEKTMTEAERLAAEAEAKRTAAPAVETRSPDLIVADEIRDWGKAFGNDAEATTYLRQNTTDDGKFIGSKEGFFKAIREATPPSVKVPPMVPADAARKNGGGGVEFTPAGEVEIDRKTRTIIEGQTFGLSDTQMNAVFSREYRDAFVGYLRAKGKYANLSPAFNRALSEGVDSEGGQLVPVEFLAKMVEREPAETAVQNFVTRLQTGSDKLTMPKNAYSASNLYTTGVRVQWVDEKTGPTSEADATDFGNVTVPIHTAMMYHDVTNNMIEDSAFDIMGWLANKFRETADVVTENVIINGTGIGQPAGILNNPGGTDEPATVISGHASQLTADGLMDLAYSLLGRYTANARFVFNRLSAEKAIAKLKDASDRYLFAYGMTDQNGIVSARPTSLLGFPIISSDFMPDVAANAEPIIFGDLGGYYLVNRVGFSIQVLTEIVATANKVRVLGRMRLGGQVAEDWRLKIQTVSA